MKLKFLFWQDGDHLLGYLEDYPDYMSQGETLEELKENLKSIFMDIKSGEIPSVVSMGEIEIS